MNHFPAVPMLADPRSLRPNRFLSGEAMRSTNPLRMREIAYPLRMREIAYPLRMREIASAAGASNNTNQ